MSGTNERLSKSSTMRMFLIALVPALLVFIAEEATKTSKHPPAPIVKDPMITHVLKRADWDIISGFVLKTSTMLTELNKLTGGPASAQTQCLASLKTGVVSYVSPMLGLLQQEINRSLSMKNTDDETLINNNIAAISKNMLEAVPTLDVTLSRLEKSCAGDPGSMRGIQQMRILLDKDLSLYLRDIQLRTTPRT